MVRFIIGSRGVRLAGSVCFTFSKYRDHMLTISLQGRKKRLKRSSENEVVYNERKFMKSESEVGITIPLSKVQKRVAEATRVSRTTLWRVLKEGENMKTGVTMAFSTPRKLIPKVCIKNILDNFDEALLRKIVHNFYITENSYEYTNVFPNITVCS